MKLTMTLPGGILQLSNHLLVLVLFVFISAGGKAQSAYIFRADQLVPNESAAKFRIELLDSTNLLYRLETKNKIYLSEDLPAGLSETVRLSDLWPDLPLQKKIPATENSYQGQYHLELIKAIPAWQYGTGNKTPSGHRIVVAVLDNGFDFTHPELKDALFLNSTEVIDGVDNDKNGYTDDIHGWNFADNSPDYATQWHGQNVSGVIAARTHPNGYPLGVAPEALLMPFTVTRTSEMVKALAYVRDMRRKFNQSGGSEGALIVAVNLSLGVPGVDCRTQPLWDRLFDELGAEGVLSVAAPPNLAVDVDTYGDIPSSCGSDFLLVPLALTENGEKMEDVGYGKSSVDIGVPGQSILTTGLAEEPYGFFSGTSAAAPQLSGAIAALYSISCDNFSELVHLQPEAAGRLVRNLLISRVQPISGLDGYAASAGVLDIHASAIGLLEICEDLEASRQTRVAIFPNPVIRDNSGASVNIEIKGGNPEYLRLYNPVGVEVFSNEIQSRVGLPVSIEIPMEKFTKGIWLLTVSEGKDIVSKKLIIR